MIKILIVDDGHLIRQGLKALLELEPDLQIVGEAQNGQIALARVKELQPDVVLMDIRMPIMDGVTATKEICQQFPHVNILVLTTFDDDTYVAAAIRAVNLGYTHLAPDTIAKVIANRVDRPEISLPPLAELTPRELEVLKLIAVAANNREIAQQLYISEGTVKNHVLIS